MTSLLHQQLLFDQPTLRNPMNRLLAPARTMTGLADVALLLARVAVGVVLLAHGLQKAFEFTPAGTTGAFAQMGVPAAGFAAWFTMLAEIVGGAALVLGVLTPVFAAINLVSMIGAIVLVHLPNGIFVAANGYELVLTIAAALVPLAALGAGRWSVDAMIARATAEAPTVSAAPERDRALVG
jgi:putative oxidoreductase